MLPPIIKRIIKDNLLFSDNFLQINRLWLRNSLISFRYLRYCLVRNSIIFDLFTVPFSSILIIFSKMMNCWKLRMYVILIFYFLFPIVSSVETFLLYILCTITIFSSATFVFVDLFIAPGLCFSKVLFYNSGLKLFHCNLFNHWFYSLFFKMFAA